MKSPFQFGKIVSDNYFTNRDREIKKLIDNFNNGTNTILISPRRWGKSSLVYMASNKVKNTLKNTKFCFLDLFKCRDETEFCDYYVREILKSTSTKIEEIVTSLKTYFGKISPSFTFGADPLHDFSVSFDLKDIERNINIILDLSEKVAARKKINLVICIDEFQNLNTFHDPLAFQKKMRSAWQHHKNVTYCLYGSKKTLLMEFFQNQSMPFYKFGDLFFLDKMKKLELSRFIVDKFNSTGKSISEQLADSIVDYMQCHPYYVQQLAHLVWVNTDNIVNDVIINMTLDEMLNQNSLLFKKNIEMLSDTQLNFLKAVADGITSEFSSKNNLQRYKLGTSGNVVKIKHSLAKNEILDFTDKIPVFIDPAFELWFKSFYQNG